MRRDADDLAEVRDESCENGPFSGVAVMSISRPNRPEAMTRARRMLGAATAVRAVRTPNVLGATSK
jgi:hypothetical protein